ncbi:MAG TPA: hypothetical protein VIL26_02695 [Clostridia bacterium]
MAKTKRKTGKIIGNTIWITLVVLIVAFFVTTGLIRTNPAPKVDKPYSIQIISEGGFGKTSASTKELITGTSSENDLNKLFNTYNDATNFSALSGILENKWFLKAKLAVDADDKDEYKKLEADDIKAITAQSSSVKNGSKYLIVFRYLDNQGSVKKTAKIDGVEITYDSVYFVVRYTSNEIGSFKIYLVDQEAMETDIDYYTYEIVSYGKLTKLYNLIEDILGK